MPPTTVAATPAKFRWDTVPPAERAWLARRQEDVIGAAYRSACDAVRIGMILEDVRRKLARGLYEEWVRAELPFSVPTATRYRQVAAAFGQFHTVHFERFEPSALYVLAQLSTPAAAREHALVLVGEGQRVTHAVAVEILDAYRPEPECEADEPAEPEEKTFRCLGLVENKQTKEKSQCPVEFVTTAGLRFCPKCRERRDAEGGGKPASAELLAKRWAVVESLVGQCSEVRITRVEDTDCDEPLHSVTCHRPDDRPHNVVRRELYDALAVAAGCEETRYCSGYKPLFPEGHDVPVGLFGKNALNPGGLMYRCRRCERARRARMRHEAKLVRQTEKSATGGAQVA